MALRGHELTVAADCSGLRTRRAGIGTYTLHVMEALRAVRPDWHWSVFDGWRWSGQLPAGVGAGSGLAARLPLARDLWRLIRRRAFGHPRADVVFAPDFLPSGPCGRVVPVVHDLAVIRCPQVLPPARRRRLARLGEVLAAAPAIVAVSAFTRRELMEVFGLDGGRVVVAPPGVAAGFGALSADEVGRRLARFGLRAGGYLLAVATLEPRKNLGMLLAAHAAMPAAWRDRWPLVLVGGAGWGRGPGPGGLRLGHVDDADLPALYAGAGALCLPSLYEGFGMPVIEAMACGTPVLASTAPGLDEAAGGVAWRLPPDDPAAWAGAMARITAAGPQAELAERGRRHAAGFSWESSAAVIAQALEAAARS